MIRADRTSETAVVPAAIADATARARAIIERAQAQAEATRAEALLHARAQARGELAAELVMLAQRRDAQLAALEPQVIQLALIAARRIIGEQLALAPERLAELVAPLLARVRSARQVTLRVHPDDCALLERQLARLRGAAEHEGSLHVQADAALGRGDCVVVSDAGVLDARIETQLLALARALGVE